MPTPLQFPSTPGITPGVSLSAPQPALDDEPYDLTDMPKARQRLFDNTLKAAQGLQPVSNNQHTLRLSDVRYEGPETYSVRDRKQAILEGRTLGRPLKGTWQLTSNATGEVLDSRRMTLANVPYRTDHGTFINNGTEYVVRNQMRLLPGVFSRIRSNDEIEAHVNTIPGKGLAHRYFLDPEKGAFYLRVGASKTPLMPLLRAMGATDAQLREHWGDELVASNARHDDPSVLRKLGQKFLRIRETEHVPDLKEKLVDYFNKIELDPQVTARTLGKPYGNLGLEPILKATQKLLKLSRHEADPDDRDHMAYQRTLAPEDLFAERISRDAGNIRRMLLFKASQRGNLKSVGSRPFEDQLRSVILTSGLGVGVEETSPIELLDKMQSITRMGLGGMESTTAIPGESRSVQPSHFSYIDPVRTTESEKAGVDLYLAGGVRRNAKGQLVSQFRNLQTGQVEWRSPQDIADEAIAFPGELRRPGKRVKALQGGRIRYVPREQIKYDPTHFERAFSALANLVPAKSGVQGQRAVMGSRMLSQALPLINAEAPLVRSAVPDTGSSRSYEDEFGGFMGAVRGDKDGVVESVSPDGIKVRYADGTVKEHELYNSMPFNRRTRLHNTPLVQPGQQIRAGDLLARSNFTDDKGAMALGLNARVAFLPHEGGGNYEDAIAISEDFAKRLNSEHLYQNETTWNGELDKKGKAPYVSLFPAKYRKSQLGTLDEDGVVKPGTTVNYGDPLVLLARQKEHTKGKVHRKGQAAHVDASLTWDLNEPGVVQDVVKTDKGPMVTVTSLRQMQEADKLANRYGGKGVIGKIIPNDEMPQDSQGRPFDVLLNSMGMISRRNPTQDVEMILGKIAQITGKPYFIDDFNDIEDLQQFAESEARKYGVSDKEDIWDPVNNRKIQAVGTGVQWFMKLHHLAEDKGQGRGTSGGYTLSGTPARGGDSSSKKLSLMDLNALLSHSAYNVIRDSKLIRGQRNEPFWLAFMQGHTPPAPRVPHVYERFVNELQAAGINPVRKGSRVNVMALTNKDIEKLAGDRELSSGDSVDFMGDLSPVKGGLFDPEITGGHNGNRWSFIKLAEPMPSPVFEEPIRRILGLTKKKFEDVLSGKEYLGEQSGPQAIKSALENINLDRELLRARAQIASGKKTYRDEAVRRLGYLKSAKSLGIHPSEWVLDKVPVLPPMFRPVAKISETGQPIVSDVNYLYKELFDSNRTLKDLRDVVGDDVGDERVNVYKAFKAVTGLGDPQHPKLVEKNVKGLLKQVFGGGGPKTSRLQSQLLSTPVDLVGRAVIQPNADLDMDEVGLPEDRAWAVYRNFVARRLKRKGMPLTSALREVRDRTPRAKQELLEELKKRPVIINRAPILHKFGMMAAWPRLVKGDALQIPPLITSGFGADFDGDQMNYHVPVSDDEVEDAVERMLPSKNLISPADFKSPMAMPRQEAQAGLYELTRPDMKGKERVFRNKADALAAWNRGELSVHDNIKIME